MQGSTKERRQAVYTRVRGERANVWREKEVETSELTARTFAKSGIICISFRFAFAVGLSPRVSFVPSSFQSIISILHISHRYRQSSQRHSPQDHPVIRQLHMWVAHFFQPVIHLVMAPHIAAHTDQESPLWLQLVEERQALLQSHVAGLFVFVVVDRWAGLKDICKT